MLPVLFDALIRKRVMWIQESDPLVAASQDRAGARVTKITIVDPDFD
jgi:hypothetical protein